MRQSSISVVVPTFNAAKYLSYALESIFRQSLQPKEIIVVDDGSTDNTKEVCEGYQDRVSYFSLGTNHGEATARNFGLSKARGDFIAFLDADDFWHKGTLELLNETLFSYPQVEVAMGYTQVIFNSQGLQAHLGDPYFGTHLGACLFRKEVFAKIGGFCEKFKMADDMDLFFRIREYGLGVSQIEKVVLNYRRHNANLSNDVKEVHRELLSACRESLRRRRRDLLARSEVAYER